MTFFESAHCKSGSHCTVCRAKITGAAFRQSIKDSYADIAVVDFECPNSRPWGYVASSDQPATACDRGNFCKVCRERILGIPFRETASKFLPNVSGLNFECPKSKPWTVAGTEVPADPTDGQKLYFSLATQLQDIMLRAKMGSCGCNKSALAQRINAKLEYYRKEYYGNGGYDEKTAKKVQG